MAVTTSTSSVQYSGNGSTTVFAYTFKIFASSELLVRLVNSTTGAATAQTLGTHYTVDGVGLDAGGTVTFVTAPASGFTVDIRTQMALTQPTVFRNQGSFLPATHESAMDRLVREIIQVDRKASLALRLPDVYDPAGIPAWDTILSLSNRKGRYIGFNATTGAPELFAGMASVALSQSVVGTALYPQTAGEIAAGVTPSNYGFPALHIQRYGAAVDNSTNDYAAINNAILSANAAGGGRVFGFAGRTARVSSPLIVLDDVVLDLEGGKIRATLSGSNDYGVRLRNYAAVENGEIEVVSSGSPGSQGGIHSPVVVGAFYGEGGTAASPGVDSEVTGWRARNLRLSTDKSAGGVGIQVISNANNGLIENIEIPDSSLMVGGVHLDWGTVGTIDSNDITTSRNNFNSGTAYTTHPNNILIRNIKVGNLTRSAASHGVRLSGVHHITVQNVDVEGCTYSGVFHTAGDCGYEFAPAAVKQYAHRMIVVEGVNIRAANDGWGVFIDAYADNVAAAVGGGYSPLLPVIARCDIVVRNVQTRGSAGASAQAGFRIQNCIGGTFIDCEASGHKDGLLGDTGADWVRVIGGRFHTNREKGIYIHHGTDLPEDWLVDGVKAWGNATDSGVGANAGVSLGACRRVRVVRCDAGATGETTQDYGYQATNNTVDAEFSDNYVTAVATSGVGYVIGTSNDYGILRVFRNNRTASGVATKYAGADVIPVDADWTTGGSEVRRFRAARAVLSAGTTPNAAFPAKVGDIIYYSDPIAADYIGTACVTAGSPGTWKRFGATVA